MCVYSHLASVCILNSARYTFNTVVRIVERSLNMPKNPAGVIHKQHVVMFSEEKTGGLTEKCCLLTQYAMFTEKNVVS